MNLDLKYEALKNILKKLENLLVAFSGGVDSTLLLKCCIDTLGKENVLAFIGSSPAYPSKEIEEAKNIAHTIGAECLVIETDEMEDVDFIRNTKERCYFCKLHLFDKAWEIAKERGLKYIVEGSNLDDMSDFRPGRKACIEQNVVSPLLEAQLTKSEIRDLSRALSLPTHDKPSYACLASRIPYGTPIDSNILKRIELSEEAVKSFGVKQVRVRHHGSIAKIEVAEDEIDTVMACRNEIAEALTHYGFTYVSLDLKGYRTGSMNET
jgi:uncharacterized protein